MRTWLKVALLLFAAKAWAEPRPKIILSGNDLPVYKRLSTELVQVLNEHATDLSFEAVAFPPKRILTAVSSGQADGNILRPETNDPDLQQPDLIKVPTPIIRIPSLLIIAGQGEDITSLEQLGKKHVGMVNGSVHSMRVIPKDARILVNSVANGLMMVRLGRIDAMSALEIGFYGALQEIPPTNRDMHPATLRVPTDFHIYVHKRIADRVPAIDAILMKPEVQSALAARYAKLIEDLKR